MSRYTKAARGYVYLVQDAGSGVFKVGQTRDLRHRLQMLAARHGRPLRVIWYVVTNDCERLERRLICDWQPWLSAGREWFDLPSDRVAEFRATTVVNYADETPVQRRPGEIDLALRHLPRKRGGHTPGVIAVGGLIPYRFRGRRVRRAAVA